MPSASDSATPILDGRAPMPARRRASVGRAVSVFAALFWFASSIVATIVARADTLLVVAGLAVAGYVAVVVYEAGHLIAGWAGGYAFRRIHIWPFAVSRAATGLRVRASFDRRQPHTSMMPPAGASAASRIRFSAGGPAANALGAVAAGVAIAVDVAHGARPFRSTRRSRSPCSPRFALGSLAHFLPS